MSLRVQGVSTNHESRPVPRDNKKLGFLKRWVSVGISCGSRHNQNSNMNRNHQQHRDNTHNNITTSTTTSSSCNLLNIISTTSSSTMESLSSTAHKNQYHSSCAILKNERSIEHMMMCRESHYASLPSVSLNIMNWMQNDCPKDVVPLILAFAGPQKIVTIGRVNHFWRQFVEQEATWRRLCESLYKWKTGDNIPDSWKKYYQYNPCVPVDYFSIHTALSKVIENANEDSSKPSAIRVLLRPGRYDLRKAITMDETITSYDKTNNSHHSLSVTVEAMAYLPENFLNDGFGYQSIAPHLPSDEPKGKLKTSIRNIFRCRTVDVESEDEGSFVNHENLNENLEAPSLPSEQVLENAIGGDREGRLFETPSGTHGTYNGGMDRNNGVSVNRATLVLKTRRHNEPLIRVLQGSFTIRNIDLRHGSLGNDIWNGNSAIQIQNTLGPNSDSFRISPPTVILDSVDVTSSSGRGIVNIDGGHLKIRKSHIHDCAATGIYVGGSGSQTTIEQSDVIYNGRGNARNRRGIGAGHSGIYLEQGRASIIDCNISRNTLTGISAISPVNAFLSLQESDLVSNGTFQLEMPDIGSAAHRNSVTRNNNLASSGKGRSRSMFSVE